MNVHGPLLGAALLLLAAPAARADVVAPADVKYADGAVEMSLSGQPGDPVAGREAFLGRKLGNCLACHTTADAEDQPFHGEVGPPLDGVAERWSAAELRGIVANSKMTFEDTIMPAFYRDGGYNRIADDFAGKTILTAQQVEDVVAYLMTLK